MALHTSCLHVKVCHNLIPSLSVLAICKYVKMIKKYKKTQKCSKLEPWNAALCEYKYS